MKQQLFIRMTIVAAIITIGVVVGGWYALRTTTHTFNEQLAREQGRIAQLEAGLMQTAADAAALRAELEEQELIRVAETENIRASFDASVSELVSTVGTQSAALKTLSSAADIAGLIDRWSPYVYDITCTFRNTKTQETFEGSGSATLMYGGGGIRFVSNAHVVEEDGGTLVKCELDQPGTDTDTITILADAITVPDDHDVAYGALGATHPAVTSGDVCVSEPRIGERIVTLGYPAIGAKESVTVTEGIISGFDEDYYATSAKIERGNSGGAAVSIERNCFLGLPTLVVAGRIESLARILPASDI